MACSASRAGEPVYDIDIPSMNAAEALNRLAEQTGAIMLFPYDLAGARRANAVSGRYTLLEGLDLLLRGTGLSGVLSDKRVVNISGGDDEHRSGGKGDMAERNVSLKTKIAAVAASIFSASAASGQGSDIGAEPLEEIIVTSSRIQKSGFEAPTPVTVLTAENIEARGATNIANIINELPGFTGSRTSTSTVDSSRDSGSNALNLRGLGTNRNLVLVNGRRHAPTDEFGTVDINVIPSLAVERIEVVTGGASAAWGSDAISGVINIIYDKNLDGLKLETQFGVSSEGDAEERRIAMAYGAPIADGRGRFLIAADYVDNKGIPLATARDWSNRHYGLLRNPEDTGPNDGIPAFRIRQNATLFLASPNGVTFPFGPLFLGHLEFLPDGTAVPRDLGSPGGVLMEGGSGSAMTDFSALAVPVERKNLLATFDYALADEVNVYFEGSTAQSDSSGGFVQPFFFGEPILSGNPYLPADIQADMTAQDIPFLLIGRTFDEFGPITAVSKTHSIRLVGGINGEIGKRWTWNAYYQYGRTDFSNRQANNLIWGSDVTSGNLQLALDAVVDPGTGEIVCRSGGDCVPLNVFGAGSPSRAAQDYVTGTSISDTVLEQQVVAASISGDVFDAWAGPVSAAAGVEFRKESLQREVDDLSERSMFLATNAQPLSGSFDVKEVFAEILVPLLAESSSGQGLDLNGAARFTDYSTSGSVATWKLGITYEPVSAIRVRGTVSRDIRAPAIGEVFLNELLGVANVDNPFTGNSDFIFVRNKGNPDIQEETATTRTVGVVLSPSWLEKFQFSVDWFDIDIDNGINQIATQDIVDRCADGEGIFCDLIDFAPDNTVLLVENSLLNLGTYHVKGLDFEARYLRSVGADGVLDVNIMANNVYDKTIAPDGINPVDFAGTLNADSVFGLPKWKTRANVSYSTGPLGMFAQLRYIGEGKYTNNFGPEDLSPEDNDIDAEMYLDLSARYRLDLNETKTLEIFAGVDNVFDNEPPAMPVDFVAPLATNPVFYDVIGRYFYGGVRVGF